MAQCYLTSHVEIATTDRVVGGRTIKQGQAIIVSDVQVGGGAGNSQIDICKIAQYVGNKLECVPIANDLLALSGTDGNVFAGNPFFASVSAGFNDNGVVVGDFLTISSGVQQGTYGIVQINSNDVVALDTTFENFESNLSWSFVRNQRKPDYSKVLRALPVSAGAALPHLRYFPMFGPGDHFGSTMTTDASAIAIDTNAQFDDIERPIPTGGTAYLEILTGADAGFHNIITGGVAATELTLSAALTATAQNIQYRVRLVSPHATHVMVSDWGSEKVAIPIQDSFEVKIAGAVRNLADAQALDAASEIPDTTRAVDLFGAIGPFLGCYRLQRGADEDGVPLDNRVLIPAKPWRGHDVDGVLFFRSNGLQKYTGSTLNPVFPIRWLRDMYRVEIAIARETREAPTAAQQCV